MSDVNVVVTGMGSISPHGRGVSALWDGLLAGQPAFRDITLFDASPFRSQSAGEVEGYPVLPGGRPRAFRMLQHACAEALRDAMGLEDDASDADTAGALMKNFTLKGAAIVTGTNFGVPIGFARELLRN